MAVDVNNTKELGRLIDGKSDADIYSMFEHWGPDDALDRIFEGMSRAFLADKARGQSAVVQWDIRMPKEILTYQVKVDNDQCTFARGTRDEPRVTLSATLPDFLRLITGQIPGDQAFFGGKLKLSGDIMFALTQENWFDKQKD